MFWVMDELIWVFIGIIDVKKGEEEREGERNGEEEEGGGRGKKKEEKWGFYIIF